MATTSAPSPLTRRQLIRLLSDPDSDTLLCWLRQHVTEYEEGDATPLLPASKYRGIRIGSHIKFLRGPENILFKGATSQPLHNEAHLWMYGRIDDVGTSFRMFAGLYPPVPPITPARLQTCRYTLGVRCIDAVVPAFYDSFLDTRSGFALASRSMADVCPRLIVQRKLYGQSLGSSSTNFKLTLPAVWVDPASANTEAPSPRKGGYESDEDAEPYSPSNPGPVGTFYPASALSEWRVGLLQSDNMVTIQPKIFNETGTPIHPALFEEVLTPGKLIKARVKFDFYVSEEEPVKPKTGPKKGLYGTTLVTELHVLTYAEDAPPPDDGEEDNNDDNGDDNASPRDPTPGSEHQNSSDTERDGGNDTGAETRPAADVFGSTTANPLAEAQHDSVPDFFHAVAGVLDDDVMMAGAQEATGVPKVSPIKRALSSEPQVDDTPSVKGESSNGPANRTKRVKREKLVVVDSEGKKKKGKSTKAK